MIAQPEGRVGSKPMLAGPSSERLATVAFPRTRSSEKPDKRRDRRLREFPIKLPPAIQTSREAASAMMRQAEMPRLDRLTATSRRRSSVPKCRDQLGNARQVTSMLAATRSEFVLRY